LYDVSGRLIELVVKEMRGLVSRRSKIEAVLGLPFDGQGDLKEVPVFIDNGCQVFTMFSAKLVEKLGVETQAARRPVNLYDISGRPIERVETVVSVEMRLRALTTQIRGLVSRRSKIEVVCWGCRFYGNRVQ
jgi:hypothetical protein